METYTEQTGRTANIAGAGAEAPLLPDEKETLLRDLYVLPGREILDRILDMEKPRDLVQKLPSEDFFWLVKKIGDPILLDRLRMEFAGLVNQIIAADMFIAVDILGRIHQRV